MLSVKIVNSARSSFKAAANSPTKPAADGPSDFDSALSSARAKPSDTADPSASDARKPEPKKPDDSSDSDASNATDPPACSTASANQPAKSDAPLAEAAADPGSDRSSKTGADKGKSKDSDSEDGQVNASQADPAAQAAQVAQAAQAAGAAQAAQAAQATLAQAAQVAQAAQTPATQDAKASQAGAVAQAAPVAQGAQTAQIADNTSPAQANALAGASPADSKTDHPKVQASKSEKTLAAPAAPFAAPLPKATAKGTADKAGHAIPAAGAADLQPSVAAKPTQAATAADTFKPGAAPGNQDANANAQLTGGNDRTSNAKSHAGTPNKTDQASTASDPTAAGIPAAAVQAAELENTDSKLSAATTSSDSSNTKSAQPGIPLPDGASVTVARDAHHAEAAHAAQESPKEAPADTMDQIVLGLKGKFDARMGKAEIKLDPPNMGRVNVSLSLENGSLTAQFQSDSDSVRDLLRTHMDKLKSVLQAQGVAVDRLAVDSPVAQPGSSASGGGQQSSFDSATHDGRSAGQYQQNGRQQQQPAQGEAFARMFRQTQDAPFDMVA